MIPLTLITGFLGSGKTTLLEHLARLYQDRRIVWLINEFSVRDMDSERLAGRARDVVSIAGGSIFCRCKVTEFLEQLRGLPERFSPEAVVVEASGMADPVVAGKLLRETGLDHQYTLGSIVAVVDPGTLLKLLHTLPNIRAQIEASTLVLVNKTDLHPIERIEQAEAAVRAINPSAPIIRTCHSAADIGLLGTHPPLAGCGQPAPCVDPHFVKFEIPLEGQSDVDELRKALEPVLDEVYRVKGIARSGGRTCRFDYSGSGWHVEPVAGILPPALVVIARGSSADAVRGIVREIQNT